MNNYNAQKKKAISYLLLAVYSIYSLSLPVGQIYAASSLQMNSISLNGDQSGNVSLNPGASFGLYMDGKNNGSVSLTDVYGIISFYDNSQFSYDENFKGGINAENPIPLSSYSSVSGLAGLITQGGDGPLMPGDWPFLAYGSFTADIGSSRYQNDMDAYFTGMDGATNVISDKLKRIIYINVRPHIIDYYFENSGTKTNQIQGGGAQNIDFFLKVKDYNGCTNIDGGAVRADLSQIGLSNSETLTYDSCDSDGKTAYFKKSGISTMASLATYNFNASDFSATDENGNQNTLTDPNTNFSSEDKKAGDDLPLTVVAADAPQVTTTSLSYSTIGGPLQDSTNFRFSGNQSGETKVTIGSDGSCNGGTIIQDWSGSGSYAAGSTASITISASQLTGSDGSYTVYGCVRNTTLTVGSTAVTVTKDTTPPNISAVSVDNGSVVTNDPIASFQCSENGTYEVSVGGFYTSSGTTGGAMNNVAVTNSFLVEGTNQININCSDNATNKGSSSVNIIKSTAPPTMSGSIVGFSDNDIDFDGLDGYDLDFRWHNSTGSGYAYFESYRLYLLPSNVAFTPGSQTYVKLIADKTAGSWIGDSTLTKDSTNTSLVNGGSYKMCIAIQGTNAELGEAGCSNGTLLKFDTVQHAAILSARFSSGNILEVTTDATLDTDLSSHSGSLVSFTVGGTTYTGSSISSINGKIINFTIQDLNDLSASGSNLIADTGSIHSFSGGFNNYFSSGALLITDGQNPTITNFTNQTASAYSNFYTGSIALSYTLGENLKAAGSSYIRFSRSGGNPGSDKIFNITDPTKLTAGAHTISVDLNALGLNSGTYYSAQFIGSDLSSNIGNSAIISNIKFDNAGPAIMTLSPVGIIGITNPMLNWATTTDDLGNGSGVKGYYLRTYTGTTCTGSYSVQDISNPLTLQYQALLADMNNYAWNISAYDNLGNQSSASACDSFTINTTVPSFSSQSVKDTVVNSTQYAKGGNNVEISANIANTDSSHIWIDASSLKDGSYANISCSAPISGVTCTYSAGIAKFVFSSGFGVGIGSGVKQVRLTATNTAGINTGSVLSSITLDNAAPAISGSPIASPVTAFIFGGTTKNIVWTTSSITDDIGLTHLSFSYSSDGGSTWNLIGTGTNSSPYAWNMGALSDGSNYKVKITAYDNVGNSNSTTSQTFIIDKTTPTIGSINLVLDKDIYAGLQSAAISWNSANISDTNLGSLPISLEYSTDSGSNWSSISTGNSNSGSANWTIPGAINSESVKIKLSATDLAGNTGSVIGSGTYFIDNTLPAISVTFAGNGGTTPQNGKYINDSGIDISAESSDAHMDKAYYSLQNLSDTTYWNQSGNGWIGTPSWNLICTDGNILGTDNSCDQINQSVLPAGIIDQAGYRLIVKSTDEAGNEKSYNPVDYIGDTTPPDISIATASGTYFSGSITISGSSADSGAGLSTTDIQIKKVSTGEWWNGNNWINTGSLMLVTSGSAANWNYSFAAPFGDDDGENYLVNVISHDQTFKTNNSSTESITVILDKGGPAISGTGFWIHPSSSTGEIVSGGSSYTIAWDSTKITDNLSGISYIGLEYWDGSQYQRIAGNFTNDGSHSFTLPLLDVDSSIRLTAYDNIGNSNGIVSPTFTIDSIPPSIIGIDTVGDTAGQINGLIVRFSELTTMPTDAYNNFTSSLGTISSMDLPVNTSTGTSVKLNFAFSVGDTSSVPTIDYTSGNRDIKDRADNLLATSNSIQSADKASPIIKKIEAMDNDENGKIDALKVAFSENILSTSDILSYQINNALPGLSISSATTSGSLGNLNLNESSSFDTSTGGMTVGFNNDGSWKDSDGNLASSPTMTLTDAASPVIISSMTVDANSNHKIDAFKLQFSESLTGASLATFGIDNLAVGSNAAQLTASGNELDFTISETSADNDTGIKPRLNYSGSSLKDETGNTVSAITDYYVADKLAPKILSRETADNDGDGKIDAIGFVFSEDLAGNISSFIGSASGYNINSYSFSGNIAYMNLDERSSVDSGATPYVRIMSNSSLTDQAGNFIATENSYANAIDKVGPVIVGARFNPTGNKIYLTFSENISTAMTPASFILSGATSSITSVNFTPGQKTGDVTLDGDGINFGTSEMSLAPDSAADSIGNKDPLTSFFKVVGSVVINEVMFSATRANQYVELRNLTSSSIDISGWKIGNGGGNGTDITIPASSTLDADGLYLIAYGDSSFSGVTANHQSTEIQMDPVSQNDITLSNGSAVIDIVKSSPWPKGNGSGNISMERKDSCDDGLDANCFYDGQDNSNFADAAFRGTPGKANLIDVAIPTISSFTPINDTIKPTGNVALDFNYEDDAGGTGIDPNTAELSLYKWNGTSYIANTNFSSGEINGSHASYTTDNLAYGKYKAAFSISDVGGNKKNQDVIFYVDQMTMSISRNSASIQNVKSDSTAYFGEDMVITLQTVGAGFDLKSGGDNVMTGPGGGMGSFDGNYGFGYDYDSIQRVFDGGLIANDGASVGSQSISPDTDGNLKTYTYTIRYGTKINNVQAAGTYHATPKIVINFLY